MDVVEMVNVTAYALELRSHDIFRQNLSCLVSLGFLRAQALDTPPYLPCPENATVLLTERPVLSWYQGPFSILLPFN
jgi:hypothetical protein